MKTKGSLLILLSLLMLSMAQYGYSSKQESNQDRKSARKEKRLNEYNKVKKIIESKDFVFNANRAYPTGMRSIDLISNPGSITVKNDSVVADLPFFGRSYVGNYGGEAGMKFEGKIVNEKINANDKKLKIIYSFSVNDVQDQYDVTIVVTSPESASVSIISRDKAAISYSGELISNDEKDGK